MPEYRQTVTFEKEFVITARNAEIANEKLEDLIRQAEWNANITNRDGRELFTDEPIECSKCKGMGVTDESEEIECVKCNGSGEVPFDG